MMKTLLKRLSAFALLGLLLLPQVGKAQWKKDMLEGIDTLMNKESYERAIPMLRKWLREYDSDDAFATYRLGLAYEELMKELYLHQEKKLQPEYDSTIQIYERAIKLVDRRDLRRNKDYYQAIFFSKDYEEEDVKGHYREALNRVEAYYGRLAFLRVKLIPIQQGYMNLEARFRNIIAPYKKMPELHRNATEEEIERIRALQLQTVEVKKKIEEYEQVFRQSPELNKRQYQEFSWQPIKGLSFYGLSKEDFKKKKIGFFDFGQWSEQVLEKIYQFRKLKKQLLEYNKELTENINAKPVGNAQDTASTKQGLLAWREKLLQYDQDAQVPEVLLYQLQKWSFLIESEETRRIFAQVYPDKQTRDQLIDRLSRQIIELTEQLRGVPTDTSAYEQYPEFVGQYFGGKENIRRWRILEENQLTQYLTHWNSIRAKTAALKASLPDSVSFAQDGRILLRSAKFDLREAQKKGWYINEQIFYLEDSTFLSQGRYSTEGQVRPYFSLIDSAGYVRWMYNFPDESEWCERVSNIKVFPDGSVSYFAYRNKAGAERVSLEYLSPEGERAYSRVMAGVPEQVFYTSAPRGAIIIRQEEQGDGERSFSRYSIEGYAFDQEARPVLTRFLLRGHIAGIEAYEGGLFFVANFLEYQDLMGNFSDSRAYKKGGFNVLAINLSLQKKQAIFDPIFSMKPIIATSMALEADGKLRLQGLQGDYKFYSQDNITGGEPWQHYIAP